MSSIRIDVGVYTALDVDLSGFNFTGVKKVVLTVKNKNSEEVLILREFTAPAVHTVTVTPQESTSLSNGAINNSAFSSDGTHLNDHGRKAFGELIGGSLISPS